MRSTGVQGRDDAALAFNRFTTRFHFVAKISCDGAYQGPIVQTSSPRSIEIVKRNQRGFKVLSKRWIVEQIFAWFGINRRLSKDFECFAPISIAFIQTAMIKLMARRLACSGYS